jgi:hypothetical protein
LHNCKSGTVVDQNAGVPNRLAIHQLLRTLRIPRPQHINLRGGTINFAEIVWRQLYVNCAYVLLQAVQLGILFINLIRHGCDNDSLDRNGTLAVALGYHECGLS